jgi:hypothetical protein
MAKSSTGYKKPPQHTQFKQGQSGNLKGRPKGSRNLSTELRAELKERISISEGGVKRMVSKQRGLVKTLYARSIKGDSKAMDQILKLIGTYLDDDLPLSRPEAISAEDQRVIDLFEERVRSRIANENNEEESND